MQEGLDGNDILMYSTHNEGKSLVAERFIRTLKSKICKEMTVKMKSYLGYLNRLVDKYNNTYHCSIGKKKHCDIDYYIFTKEIETNPELCKFRVGDRVRITKYKNIFSKGYARNWSKDTDSVLKTSLGRIKLKKSNSRKLL